MEHWTLENHPSIRELVRPLTPLIRDQKVTEISINGFGEIWIERVGLGYAAETAPWCTADWAWMFCLGLANVSGHSFPTNRDDVRAKPILSLVLPGRHRLHAILGHTVPSGIALSIRLYRVDEKRTLADFGLAEGVATRLCRTIAAGATVLVSGAVGSGKSSLLRLLAREIPRHRRVVVIGDLDELELPHPNQIALMRSRFAQSVMAPDFGDLIDSVLRLNGSVTVLNELSYDNAVPAMRLLNTGALGGFLTTLHSNSPLDALEAWRRNIAMREGSQGSAEIVAFLARTVDVVVHVTKTGVDRREVTGIAWKDPATGELDVPWRRVTAGAM